MRLSWVYAAQGRGQACLERGLALRLLKTTLSITFNSSQSSELYLFKPEYQTKLPLIILNSPLGIRGDLSQVFAAYFNPQILESVRTARLSGVSFAELLDLLRENYDRYSPNMPFNQFDLWLIFEAGYRIEEIYPVIQKASPPKAQGLKNLFVYNESHKSQHILPAQFIAYYHDLVGNTELRKFLIKNNILHFPATSPDEVQDYSDYYKSSHMGTRDAHGLKLYLWKQKIIRNKKPMEELEAEYFRLLKGRVSQQEFELLQQAYQQIKKPQPFAQGMKSISANYLKPRLQKMMQNIQAYIKAKSPKRSHYSKVVMKLEQLIKGDLSYYDVMKASLLYLEIHDATSIEFILKQLDSILQDPNKLSDLLYNRLQKAPFSEQAKNFIRVTYDSFPFRIPFPTDDKLDYIDEVDVEITNKWFTGLSPLGVIPLGQPIRFDQAKKDQYHDQYMLHDLVGHAYIQNSASKILYRFRPGEILDQDELKVFLSMRIAQMQSMDQFYIEIEDQLKKYKNPVKRAKINQLIQLLNFYFTHEAFLFYSPTQLAQLLRSKGFGKTGETVATLLHQRIDAKNDVGAIIDYPKQIKLSDVQEAAELMATVFETLPDDFPVLHSAGLD